MEYHLGHIMVGRAAGYSEGHQKRAPETEARNIWSVPAGERLPPCRGQGCVRKEREREEEFLFCVSGILTMIIIPEGTGGGEPFPNLL